MIPSLSTVSCHSVFYNSIVVAVAGCGDREQTPVQQLCALKPVLLSSRGSHNFMKAGRVSIYICGILFWLLFFFRFLLTRSSPDKAKTILTMRINARSR